MLIITPNLAVDRTLLIPRLLPGEVQRSTKTILAAGGKGMNAARAARTLGAEPVCMGFVGGEAGRIFASLALQEGFHAEWISIAAETRTCIILAEDSGSVTVINEPGPAITAQDWQTLEEIITARKHNIKPEKFICFCGSLPPGIEPVVLGVTIRKIILSGCKDVWVDTSGVALKAVLDVAPAGIKINAEEASQAVGFPITDTEQAVRAAKSIYLRGIPSVVLTLGKAGAVFVGESGMWHAAPPPIRVVNAVGSGDSFFGALICALEQGLSAATALKWGVAAGTANASSGGGGRFSRDIFERILADVRCESLPA